MKMCAIDIETSGLSPYRDTMWMIAVNYEGTAWVEQDCRGLTKVSKRLQRILEDESICKLVHNGAFDLPFIELKTGIKTVNVWDTRLAEIIILGTTLPRGKGSENLRAKYGSSLKDTLKRWGLADISKDIRENFIDRKPGIKFTDAEIQYALNDVRFLPPLQRGQEIVLKRDGLWELALLENKVLERVVEMTVRGIRLDKVKWLEIAQHNRAKYNALLRELPTTVANWNSPAQVKKFFQNRGTPLYSFTDLDQVYQSTNDPILGKFIKLRELYSFTTTYSESWLIREDGSPLIDKDGRVRASWEQLLNTGRFATSNPNLLAQPRNGGQRAAFIPASGHEFVIGDFSGQEIGIMAAAAQENVWIDALLRGEDIHSLTASLLFRFDWDRGAEKNCTFPGKCKCKLHNTLRQYAKVLNFMLAYGGGPEKFSHTTGVSMLDAKIIINRYRRVIPRLTRWLEKNAKDAIATGESFSASPYRRRRLLMGMEDWMVANQGKNNPVQAAGADMIKLAMISLPKEYMIALVWHDEIILEVKKGEGRKALKVLKTIMEQSADYITGIKGLIKVEPRLALNLTKE